ncbi:MULTISPECIES: sugar transferase [unclassified Streptomyces]|uniref:sugar transferase n=1 Tax=unclassified Streptomyces TaxID=2593676 RepID=UPI0032549B54
MTVRGDVPFVPLPGHTRARSDREPPGTGRRRDGKPAWYLPTALIVDAAGAAAPVYMTLCLAGEAHAVRYAAVMAGVWVLVRASRTRYAWRNLGERGNAAPLLRDWLILVALLAVVRAATGEGPPFHLELAGLLACLPVTVTCQGLTHRHLLARRRAGQAVRRALVIGEAAALDGLVNHLARRTDHAFVAVGVCPIGDDDPNLVAPVTARLDRQTPAQPSGDSSPVLAAARRLEVDLVFVVSGPSMASERLRRLSWAVYEDGRPLVVVPGLTEVVQRRVSVSSSAGLTMLHVAPPVRRGAALLLKAVTDRLGAALLLVLLVPVLVGVAIAVRLDSPGTILHRQIRVGRGGRQFSMAKFRTMVAGAELLRHKLTGTNEHDGLMFKMRRDPRITRVGRVLRRFSLDELPQLVNVLQGHMSLVGPRPPLPDEVAEYNEVELRRLSVKPGLTGLWQVSGRSELSWDETVALDLRYVDNWSPAGDFGILCRTLRAVFEGNGAY